MKKILVGIGFYFGAVFFAQSQTLFGPSFNGGTERAGTIHEFNEGTPNLIVRKSFESFAEKPFYTTLVQASDGKLYGMTSYGGIFNSGVIFSFDPVSSAYSTVNDFEAPNGSNPSGSLAHAIDGKLYGTTTFGGQNNYGVVFSFDPISMTYTKLFDFDNTNGAYPYGSLTQSSDGKLYGMTSAGGSSNSGVIFSFDPSSSSYTKLQDFETDMGVNPVANLVQTQDGKFYGMTPMGGANGYGVLFSFDPTTSNFAKLMDFDNANGGSPYGTLLEASDGKLYGMTSAGGTNGFGVIFSFDPTASSFAKLMDFDNSNGDTPYGSLVESNDGKLYGMTYGGGTFIDFNAGGVLFSFDPVSSAYTILQVLDYATGTRPYGSPTFAGGKLYGLTSSGGDGRNGIGAGVIFSYDLINSSYQVLKNLGSNESGANISGRLIQGRNGKLYGATTNGGDNGVGVIFSYDPETFTYTKLKDLDVINGSHPYGSLMQAKDGKFYGLTAYGGVYPFVYPPGTWGDIGVLFSFDPSSLTYAKEFDFTLSSGFNGTQPYGNLVQTDNGKLYGMTSQGGSGYRGHGAGIIFSFDPLTSSFIREKDFSLVPTPGDFPRIGPDGDSPYGGFLLARDGKLYGMTSAGAANSSGSLFSYDPNSGVLVKLIDFDGSNGANPYGNLIQTKDGNLYGMTYGGGSNDAGVIFSYDLASSTYTKLHDFDFTNGSHPYGNLMQASDGNLYGMTSGGGNNDLGVVFSFDPSSSTFLKLVDYDGSNGAIPYFGSAFVELSTSTPLPVTLVDFSGKNTGTINALSWHVANEDNIKYYELQRSNDGQNFESISQISPLGNSVYFYNDSLTGPVTPVYYYRLKIVDADGNTKYSDVIKISLNLNDFFVVANPNPFKDLLTLTIQSNLQNQAIVVLTSFDGRQLIKQKENLNKGTNILHLNVNGKLLNGAYLLTITTPQKTQTLRVIKSN